MFLKKDKKARLLNKSMQTTTYCMLQGDNPKHNKRMRLNAILQKTTPTSPARPVHFTCWD